MYLLLLWKLSSTCTSVWPHRSCYSRKLRAPSGQSELGHNNQDWSTTREIERTLRKLGTICISIVAAVLPVYAGSCSPHPCPHVLSVGFYLDVTFLDCCFKVGFFLLLILFFRVGDSRQRQRVLRHEHICQLRLRLAHSRLRRTTGAASLSLQLHVTAHTATCQPVPQAQQGHPLTSVRVCVCMCVSVRVCACINMSINSISLYEAAAWSRRTCVF